MKLNPPVPSPPRPELQRRPAQPFPAAAPVRSRLHDLATLARWVEVDETATILLGEGHDTFISALSALDGLVTAYDGVQTLKEGVHGGEAWKVRGGLVRIGLGLGGMAPGLPGNAFEAACGAYCTAEGIKHGDRVGAVGGATQLGVSVGMGMACLGLGGPVGPAMVLGCGLARVGYYLHHFEELPQ